MAAGDRSPGSVIARVQQLYELGRFETAFEEATRGLTANPGDPTLFALASMAAHRLDRHEAARHFAVCAIDAAPESDVAHAALARALRGLGQHAEAAQAAYRAVHLDPHDWRNHVLYALCVLPLPNGREVAWQAARRAVDLAPGEPAAHAMIAEVAFPGDYATPEQLALAERALTEALRLDPHDAGVQNDLARVRLARSDSGAALAGFAGAVSTDPTRVGEIALGNVALVIRRIVLIQALIVLGSVFVGVGFVGKHPSTFGRVALLGIVIGVGSFLVVKWRGYLAGQQSRAAVAHALHSSKRLLAGAVLVGLAIIGLGVGVFLAGDGITSAVGLSFVLAAVAIVILPSP